MVLLDGKKLSDKIIEELKSKINNLDKKITFVVIWIGNDEASSIYVNNKIKKCNDIGIDTKLYHLESTIKEEELLKLIDSLNEDENVNGILLQSPVPKHLNIINCFNRIDYKKDIDGFSNISMGNLLLGNGLHISCTPKGIMRLLDEYNIDLNGKNVCIINRSNIVGKPLFHLLVERNATVTMCHSKTENIEFFTKNADIIISAVGKPHFIKENTVKDNVIVIDVGISRIDGKVVGDVDFDNVSKKASFITPVPGGVGPMTIAMVLENLTNTL